MKTSEEIKKVVQEKYAQIALESESKKQSCGCGCKDEVDYTVFSDSYANVEGYLPDADLGLGCGLPTEYAKIKKGDVVVDLGSGAGNDVFVASTIVGDKGKVIGIDMTSEMIRKAEKNKLKLNINNVEFRLGEIENLPVESASADVVISNCVLNLVPDKRKAFAEIKRILKNGGRFCVSDIVLKGELPQNVREAGAMYAGCVAGALQKEEYLDVIEAAGFKNIEIKKIKNISLPDEILKDYISDEEIKNFRENEIGIFSLTVVGEKN